MEKDVALTKKPPGPCPCPFKRLTPSSVRRPGCCEMRAFEAEDRFCFILRFPSSASNARTSAAVQSKPWALFTVEHVKGPHGLHHSHPLRVIPSVGRVAAKHGQTKAVKSSLMFDSSSVCGGGALHHGKACEGPHPLMLLLIRRLRQVLPGGRR
jgi:hypothetical protein